MMYEETRFKEKFLMITLLVFALLFPLTVIISYLAGYKFVARSYFGLILITTIIYIISTVKILISKDRQASKGVLILTFLLLPLSGINVLFYMWKSTNFIVTLIATVCFVCATILVLYFTRTLLLKIISVIIAILLIVLLAFTSFIVLVFGTIGENTVVKSITSPSGTYCAEVINSDQGALGGDTIIDVRNIGDDIDLYFFEFRKYPQRVYIGEWGEFNDIDISWKSEQELIINGKSYMIE